MRPIKEIIHDLVWERVCFVSEDISSKYGTIQIAIEYEVKRNIAWIFQIRHVCFDRSLIHCIQDIFSVWDVCDLVFKDDGTIDEHNLGCINSHINTMFRMDWCPKDVIIQNIKLKSINGKTV